MSDQRSKPIGGLRRRAFIKTTVAASAAVAAPMIVPSSVFGANAPSNRIVMGYIGVGRQARGEMREMLGRDDCQIVAVADPDRNRMSDSKKSIEDKYAERTKDGSYSGCDMIPDFRDLIARDDIDAVLIYTPDHWHAIPAIMAAKAGKDIFLQKPLSLTIEEGRAVSNAVQRYGVVYITGSQQRSDARFRYGCELVRNGRVGKIHSVEVGIGVDPGCEVVAPTPPPDFLDYDMWLGPAPYHPYVEKGVQPQKGYSRPGWLRRHDYSAGMFTGWGSHHIDIMHWGLGTEHTGPVSIEGMAQYPEDGLWDVHGPFDMALKYANGVNVRFADNKKVAQGVKFIGDEGWVYVKRGKIDASDKSLLKSVIGPNETRLYRSNSHKGNWIDCIRNRAETVAPVEVGHRSCSTCIIADIASRIPGKLLWDPEKERFTNNDMANRLLSRPMRGEWTL